MSTLERVEVAHAYGPATEREAAARHTESGKRRRHLDAVVDAVAEYPGCTAGELAWNHGLTLDVVEIRRRLYDAKRLGLVRQGEARKCRSYGNKQVTWYPVERQGGLL